MYSVELMVDKKWEQRVYELWQGLSEFGISPNLDKIKGIKPHITLAVYREIVDLPAYLTKFEAFFTRRSALDLTVDSLGVFPDSKTLYLAPAVTTELLEFHRQFHVSFSEYADSALSYYLPNRWQPHCTLATKLDSRQLPEAFGFFVQQFQPMSGVGGSVSLQQLVDDGEHWIERSEIRRISLN